MFKDSNFVVERPAVGENGGGSPFANLLKLVTACYYSYSILAQELLSFTCMRVPRHLQLSTTGVFHKMWKGHNNEYVFAKDAEKYKYLDALTESFKEEFKEKVEFHGYCLMGTHTHESGRLKPNQKGALKPAAKALGDFMRNGHSKFGQGYNTRHNRKGKVAYDRPKTEEIKNEHEVLKVMFYSDTNPVRAGMVTHPTQYKHSSCRFYAYGKRNKYTKHLKPPRGYLALGKNATKRRQEYRKLLDLYLRQQGLLNDRPDENVEELSPLWEFETSLWAIRIRGGPRPGLT